MKQITDRGVNEMSKEKNGKIIIVLLVVALLSVVGLVVTLLIGNSTTKVPDFSGMTLMEATKQGAENSLEIKDGQMVDGDESDRGLIVEQYPEAGASVAKGDVVIVNISRGPGKSRTPDVIGMTTEKARKTIENSGFQVGAINQVEGVENAGTVLAQNPKGDIELEKGKIIDLDVSDGSMVYVPNLIGKSPREAQGLLFECGLKGSWEGIDWTDKVGYGLVSSQSPGKGAVVKRGTIIKYWESTGETGDEEYYDDEE